MGNYLMNLLTKSELWEVWVSTRSIRNSENPNIHYIKGNARDAEFINTQLTSSYDAIVDFMNYDYEEFAARSKILLASTRHYIWFSSCRVYADSPTPLTESSPRLLEISEDSGFLSTNRYALRKARQEDLLKTSGFNNYTIIRPYITYGSNRLQLGIYEKEQWLWRLLKGKSLVINKNIIHKTTTLTHGHDVARVISQLVGNPSAYGQIVQIATHETKTWAEILNIYKSILTRVQGREPQIYLCDDMNSIDALFEGGYNTIYDRVYNRSFSSTFANQLLGESVQYTNTDIGLSNCLNEFLISGAPFLEINPQFEAYQDILTDERLTKSDFKTNNLYEIYKKHRATPLAQLNMQKKLDLFYEEDDNA